MYLEPNAICGNHKHPRTEWFIGFGELTLYWHDENSTIKSINLFEKNKMTIVAVLSHTPHAVVNNSATQFGLLYELADDIQRDIELVEVFSRAN